MWAFIFFVPTGPLQSVDFLGILKPYQDFFRTSLWHGEIPFWNPYASLGRPFVADPQAVACWPGSLLYVLLGAPAGAWVLISLHSAWAIVATRGVALRFGAASWAAWGAGWCFVFNPKLLGHAHVGNVQYAIAFLTMPAVVLAFLTMREEACLRTISRLALVVAWQLLEGAPQVFWFTGVLVAVMAVALAAATPSSSEWITLVRATSGIIAAYAWGFALAALLVLPAAELVGQSNRSGGGLAKLSAVGPFTVNLLPSLYTFFSNPDRLWDYETMLFPGTVLAVLGVAGLGTWRLRESRVLAVVVAVIVVLASAPGTPLHGWFVAWFPGYSAFRFHARWGMVLGWLLAVAAAVFVSGRDRSAMPRVALAVAGILGLATLASVYPSLILDAHAPRAEWGILPAGCVVAAMVGGYGTTRRTFDPGTPGRVLYILGTLIGAELLVVFLFYKTGYSRDRYRPLESKVMPTLAAAGMLQRGSSPLRVYLPIKIAHNNAGMQLGYSALFGYESLGLLRYRMVAHWAMGIDPPTNTDYPAFANLDARLPWPVAGFGLQVGFDPQQETLVLRKTPDVPRAWFARSVVVAPDWQQAVRHLAGETTPETPAILERTDPRLAQLGGAAHGGEIEFVAFGLNRTKLKVHTTQPQLLVLAEPWYPGWKVAVNGTVEESPPVNGWMRAAFVPAGDNEVEFLYRSKWFVPGLAITAGALLACAMVEWRSRQKARSGRPSSPFVS